MIYLELIYVFFKIGVFGFGGGYAMISLIQFEVVDHFHWMTMQEFADILAISQITPGPISINTATYVGFNTAGILGATVATLALCLPSVVLMLFVIRFLFANIENRYVQYVFSGLRPAIVGLIFAAALLLMNTENFPDAGIGKNNFSIVICAATFIASYFYKVNPVLLIVLAGACGFLISS
ncbi:MAG: chromate transporter [Prevotellaceae bacterium]|jgi:chromate transporter|nr:chromate transporter [Prevotellaceae bacterium]